MPFAPLRAMTRIGFHASHEQWPPSQLLRFVRGAEQAGFEAAMCSDHFLPWTSAQGQSGHAWTWLGTALASTNLSFGTVCAPGDRYHPAVIAQAAATLAEMFPGRFWLAVGSGEALNEHITGNDWPAKETRNARLRECVDILRALLHGETVNHRRLVRVCDAKLYSRPEQAPPIVGAALSAETAQWVGSWADALITVANDPEPLRQTLEAFREGGGEGKPAYLQVALSFARSEAEARSAAHREWRQCVLKADQLADLPMPADFEAATRHATPEQVAERLRVSSSIQQHIDWLRRDIELGFDAIYLHQVGRNMEEFLDVFGSRVLPALK